LALAYCANAHKSDAQILDLKTMQQDHDVFSALDSALRAATGASFRIRSTTPAGGGCINAAYRVTGDAGSYFVKLNRQDLLPMFEAEAEGLQALIATGAVRAPAPVCCGVGGGKAFLAMEYLDLRAARGGCDRQLGLALAAMHRIPQAYFGWQRDNTIGSTPQINSRAQDWTGFWGQHRLGFQLRLAARHGYLGRLQSQGEKLLSGLPALLAGHQPQAALLHGDLWGGNYAADAQGQPVIFDPACYFGDREADLAMTELFGGFSRDFYAAYREAYPLDAGYELRKILYNLYHILNHLNLFGGSYLSQAEDMIERLLAEIRA
jgi:fructosamine-3-kinase